MATNHEDKLFVPSTAYPMFLNRRNLKLELPFMSVFLDYYVVKRVFKLFFQMFFSLTSHRT